MFCWGLPVIWKRLLENLRAAVASITNSYQTSSEKKGYMHKRFLKESNGHDVLSLFQKKTFEMQEPEHFKTKCLGLSCN